METGLHIFVASATARGVFAAALALVCMPAFALDAGETLRVMTFNVRGCKDMTDKVNVQQIPVEAEGVTPQTGVEYTFRFVFNYAAGTYSVYVKTGLTGFARLRENNPVNPVNPVQNFPLAASGSALSSLIGFDGDGILRSIFGNFISGFNIRLR